MTNKVRVKRLEWIAQYFTENPEEYNQATWCGTAMCIGGLGVWQFGTERERRLMHKSIENGTPGWNVPINFVERGERIFGLTALQANELFTGNPNWLTFGFNTPLKHLEAAAAIRYLIRHGKVPRAPIDVDPVTAEGV